MATAAERTKKNLDVIHDQLKEIRGMLAHEYYAVLADGKADWGHVGDLAHIRGLLNQVLGREDTDPE